VERARLAYLEIRRNVAQAEARGAFTALATLRKVERDALAAWEAEAEKGREAPEEAAPEAWLADLEQFAKTLPRAIAARAVEVLQGTLRPQALGVIEGGAEKKATG
jgi:hypothetical protein